MASEEKMQQDNAIQLREHVSCSNLMNGRIINLALKSPVR